MYAIFIAAPRIYTLTTIKHTFADSAKKTVPIPSSEPSLCSASGLVLPAPQAITGNNFSCMCVKAVVHDSMEWM